MQLKPGDDVYWKSQSYGTPKIKRGKVVAVVPERVHPEVCIPEGLQLKRPGNARDHESYLVQVGKSINLYWPLVKYLRNDVEDK